MPEKDMRTSKINIAGRPEIEKYIDCDLLHKEIASHADIYGVSLHAENEKLLFIEIHYKNKVQLTKSDILRILKEHKAEKPKTFEEELNSANDEKERMQIVEKFLLSNFGNRSLKKESQ